MFEFDSKELMRRGGLSLTAARFEIEALIAVCRATRSVSLSFYGFQALESLECVSGLHWLEAFNCSYTQVSDLTPLSGLSALMQLGCSGTQVSDLKPLSGLSALMQLDCMGTKVSDLFPLAGLRALAQLDCSDTKVSDLLPLAGLGTLTQLNCSRTQVSNLFPLARLSALAQLNCSGTQVSNLSLLAGLSALAQLDCSYTQVSDLSPLRGLSALTKLNCSYTQVSDLSPLRGLSALTKLNCSRTQVSDLLQLAGLSALVQLDCSDTKISDLSPLVGLSALVQLDCSDTKISDLSPLVGLSALAQLDCSYNKVSDLSSLAGLSALTQLACSSTQVSDLSALSALSALVQLSCAYTQVSDLSPLAGLNELTTLRCYNTKVSDLSPLARLYKLEHFDCDNCQIESWPKALLDLPKLRYVNAHDARIGQIPGEDLSQSMVENCLPNIRSYFADLEAGAAPLERTKIIVLGNGQVGKTQLRRWLLNSDQTPMPFDPTIPSTHGIEVMRGPVALPEGRVPLDASIWDFGGQDIYHGTHSLFMKTRAVFVLCWCPQQEDNREQHLDGLDHKNRPLSYWVDYVRQLAGTENPLVIVQTQCDGPSDAQPHRFADLKLDDFQSRHNVAFSAQEGRGGAALREAIGEAKSWIDHRHGVPLIGAGRLRVLDTLEDWRSADAGRTPKNRQHKLMSQDAFAALCDSVGGISSPPHLLNFLHHAGVIFYRKGLFEDQIILDQDWALNAIYAVFNRDNCFRMITRANGRFVREDVADKVWQDYGIDEQKLFLSMMQSCGIAFKHYSYGPNDDDAEYIAPELLPPRAKLEAQIERVWHGDSEICEARLRYGLLHHGLIRQILARIGGQARIFGEYWQTGVLFYEQERKSDAIIEAIADEDGWGGHIVISCRNGRARELLPLLVEEVQKIGEAIGMSPDEKPDLPSLRAKPDDDDDAPAVVPLAIGSHPSTHEKWYVSYAWGDKTPEGVERDKKVDALCDAAKARGVHIIRDKDTMGNGDSIRGFMEQLAQGDRIIAILSDKYLHSPNCMFELFHAWQKQQSNQALFANAVRTYRLPCAKFGTIPQRGAIATHWSDQAEQAEPFLAKLGEKDLASYRFTKKFESTVGDILYAINDTISPRDWDAFLDWAFGK